MWLGCRPGLWPEQSERAAVYRKPEGANTHRPAGLKDRPGEQGRAALSIARTSNHRDDPDTVGKWHCPVIRK